MRPILAAVLIVCTWPAQAVSWEENPQVGQLFKSAEVQGTFVLYDVTAQTYIGHDQPRAERQFVPASTFKIPHTLIGLAVGAVASVDEVLPYTGPPHPFIKAWAKDMGLRKAIALSNVSIYQELARRIGLARMREHVARLAYGNTEIGTIVDTFWLRGRSRLAPWSKPNFWPIWLKRRCRFPRRCSKRYVKLCY